MAGITGWAVAKICVRLKSDYLAMASIGIAEILRLVIVNEQWLTNGSLGISNIPRPFEGLVRGREADLVFLAVVWFIVLIVYVLCQRLHDSPWGRTLRAIRDNEASSPRRRQGCRVVPTADLRHRLPRIMGVAGGLSASYFKFLSPAATEPLLVTFLVWVMLMAGGSGNRQGRHCRRIAHLGHLVDDRNLHQSAAAGEWATRSSYVRMLLGRIAFQFVLQRYRQGLIPEKSPKLEFDRK